MSVANSLIKQLSLAWRNIGRNPRRSFLSLLVISMGTASLILAHAFMLGTEELMIRMSTEMLAGQAQIHHKNFKNDQEIEFTLNDIARINQTLSNDPRVAHRTTRLIFTGMSSSAHDSSMTQIYGVNFTDEGKVSKVISGIIKGSYPKDDDHSSIILGYKLAEQLNVNIGDKIVLTAAQAHTGELHQDLFRLKAIVRFNSRPLDEGLGFIALNKAQSLTGLANQAHEVAFRFHDIQIASNTNDPIWKSLSFDQNVAEGWPDIFPSLASMAEFYEAGMLGIVLILFAIVTLSILNTTFMSIYDRLYEFSVLKAIGTRSFSIAQLIIYENLILGLLGTSIGLIFGGAAIYYLSINGISYAEMEYNGMNLVEPIKTVLHVNQFTFYPCLVILMSFIAATYPAIFAAKINPTEGMRERP